MDAFAAISDPTRRKVLDLLRSSDRAAGELVDAFPHLSQPAMSKHLRILREAGLVDVRADLQRRIYSLRREGFSEVDAWLSAHRDYWLRQLDSLERHLDERARTRKQLTHGKRKKR